MTGHLVSLPGTEWTVWRDALLRSAGFPAAGLDRFSATGCAAVADAFLDGRAGQAELEEAHASALARARVVAEEIAADPLFCEALVWQNPAAAARIVHDGQSKEGTRQRGYRMKARENTIARYWQRYCGKNDTIGFFGPVTWVTLDPLAPGVRVRCGDGLIRARTTYYEHWALQAYADRLAADVAVRPWLPVSLQPHVTVDGHRMLIPGRDPLELSRAESALLARCDGRRPAAEVVAGGPDQAQALALLDGLATRGVVRWGVNLPQNLDAEEALRATLTGIGDRAARERALSGLRRLDAARASVNAARGDAGKLAAAMSRLDAEFTDVTGAASERRQGKMYAGRKLCYEDTVRDVDVTFGGPVLDALAGPFGTVILPAARWLSVALAGAYTEAFHELYAELGGSRDSGIPLDRFWTAALPLITNVEPVAGKVASELTGRWARLLGLDDLPPGTRRATLSSTELAGKAAELFTALRPAWSGARIHSPDLQICASSAEAIGRGDFTIVLGELHAMWPTLDCAMFTAQHPDQDRLRAAGAADIGPQILPLYASWCPQFSPRMATGLCDDYQLAFAPEPGTDPARLLQAMTITVVEEEDGELVAAARDGRRWPLFEVFAVPIAWFCSELFKLTTPRRHNPRITIDRLVVSRETWRCNVAEAWLTGSGGLPEYLAARRLRRTLGLPDKVFAKIGTEVKPVYLDLTSPRYVSAFATMLRAAREKAGDHTEVVMTELLPGPDQAWLPGPGGQRYFSELRLHMRDPVPAGPIKRGEDR
jgi:hypothetical protein